MDTNQPPSLEEFLVAPVESVARITPATVVYAPSGSRRMATLAGVPLDEGYIPWGFAQTVETFGLFFRFGVQHLIVPSLGPRNLMEGGNYGERIVQWIADALAGETAIEIYKQNGWQARMLASAKLPLLVEADARLHQETADNGRPTLWWYLVADDDEPWQDVLRVARASAAQTRAEAALALYGTTIPPASLYIAHGKPSMGTTMIPPLLTDEGVQGYWTQRPGGTMTEGMLRRILYDYAYSRRTWQRDHGDRYAQAHKYAKLWDNEHVLGTGRKLDGYWYPDPFPGPTITEEQE
jgi:hypothetical protein